MAANESAQKNHDELFPGHPELIEIFDNFAFDEILSHGSLDARTRLMVQLASLIASQALREYRGCPRISLRKIIRSASRNLFSIATLAD